MEQNQQFIPENRAMDAYTWDRDINQVTIQVNMNNVIVNNKTSPYILLFH